MLQYEYATFTALPLAPVLDTVVEEVARQGEQRSFEARRHGLPIWIVREQTDHRTNKAQIEAVFADFKLLLSLTPDAYEDRVSMERGTRRLVRLVADREQVLKYRRDVPLNEFAAEPEGVREAIASLKQSLEQTLNSARELVLSNKFQVTYASPFGDPRSSDQH